MVAAPSINPNIADSLPALRCDRGMAKSGSNGCVYPAAAAIYELDGNFGSDTEEGARHVALAQATGSPGSFKLKAGTRAIADTGSDGSAKNYSGLQRAQLLDVINANRDASCNSSTSIFKTGGAKLPSRTCRATPTPVDCQCDEYPFASTWNGAAYDRMHTSVQLIWGSDNNQSGGGRLNGFYTRERLLDFALNPTGNHGDNDYFWVKVESGVGPIPWPPSTDE